MDIYDVKVIKALDKYFSNDRSGKFTYLHPNVISHMCPFRHRKEKNWKITDFEIGKRLGKGGFAAVHLAMHRRSRMKCALKIFSKSKMLKDENHAHTFQEIRSHLHLGSHPNIVSCYGCFDVPNDDRFVMVLEYVPGLELWKFVHETGHLTFSQLQDLFYQVVFAVKYCHDNGVTHRDVKLENFVVNTETGELKLLDFGLSLMSHQAHNSVVGTWEYTAPEMRYYQFAAKNNRFEHYDHRVDIWSCGIIFYALMAGMRPWPDFDEDEHISFCRMLYECKQESPFIPYEELIPKDLRPLLKRMLRINPKARIGLQEVLEYRKLFASHETHESAFTEVQRQLTMQSQLDNDRPRRYSLNDTEMVVRQSIEPQIGLWYDDSYNDYVHHLEVASLTQIVFSYRLCRHIRDLEEQFMSESQLSEILHQDTPQPQKRKRKSY